MEKSVYLEELNELSAKIFSIFVTKSGQTRKKDVQKILPQKLYRNSGYCISKKKMFVLASFRALPLVVNLLQSPFLNLSLNYV